MLKVRLFFICSVNLLMLILQPGSASSLQSPATEVKPGGACNIMIENVEREPLMFDARTKLKFYNAM